MVIDNEKSRQLTNIRFMNLTAPKKEWIELNPILLNGEIGVETDTGRFKIGSGAAFTDTSYPRILDRLGLVKTIVTDDEGLPAEAGKTNNTIDYIGLWTDIIYPITLTDAVKFKSGLPLTDWVEGHKNKNEPVATTTSSGTPVNDYASKILSIKIAEEYADCALSLKLIANYHGEKKHDVLDVNIWCKIQEQLATANPNNRYVYVTSTHADTSVKQFDVSVLTTAVDADKNMIVDIYITPVVQSLTVEVFELARAIRVPGKVTIKYFLNAPFAPRPTGLVNAIDISNAHDHLEYFRRDGSRTISGNIRYNMHGADRIPVEVVGGDKDGLNITVGGGGSTTIYSGEATGNIGTLPVAGAEILTLASDQQMAIFVGCQGGGSAAKKMVIDTDLAMFPSVTNTGSIGQTDFKWANIWAHTLHGALDGNASSATKLATARSIALTGAVTGSGNFDGSGNLSITTTVSHSHSYLPLTGGNIVGDVSISGYLTFNPSTLDTFRGIKGSMDTDIWYIRGRSTAADLSYLEISTGDNGNEPIIVRQYTANAVIEREAFLLNGAGNTLFPGSIFEGGVKLADKYAPADIRLKNITIAVGAWNASTKLAEYANASITADHSPDVRFSAASMDAAGKAGITVYTVAGKLMLKATTIPTVALVIEAVIFVKM